MLALGLRRHLSGPAPDLARQLAGAAGTAPATGGVVVSATVTQAETAPVTELPELPAGEPLEPLPGRECPGAVGTGDERDLERPERCHWGYVLEMSRVMRTQAISVQGLIELLLAGRLSEVQRGYAETVRFSGKMLLSTSSDIINLIRMDVGNVQPVSETFEVRTLLDQVVGRYCQAARCKGVDLIAEVATEVPHQLVGDRGGLGRVLSNLVAHAVHMTTSGKIAVSLRSPEAPPGGLDTVHLLCEVQDTGAGLAPEVQARIFGKFSEDEAPPFPAVEIEPRLRLTRNLLELMGCHLAVVSKVGVGSTFWFKIPLHRAAAPRTGRVPLPFVDTGPADGRAGDESETAVQLAATGPTGSDVGSPRILLVENDYEHQTLCLVMLEALACRVSVAGSTGCALELLSRQHFDLILLDGQAHCLELAARLRRAEAVASPEGHRHLPAIALASHDILQQGHHEWHAADIDAWLAKPFTLGSLARELGKWLPRRLRGVGEDPVHPWPGPGTVNRPGDGLQRGTSVIDERVLDSIRMVERGSPNLLASLVDCFFLELDGGDRTKRRSRAVPEIPMWRGPSE